MTKVKILHFSDEHKKDVLKISALEVGKNFIGNDFLNFYINNENARGKIAFVKNKIVGFSFYLWCSRNEISKYIFADNNWLMKITKGAEIIGYINLTAVKKEFQNAGIGKKLVEISIAELKKKTNTIANVVWISSNKKNLGTTLQTFGLKPMKTIHHYWREDSIKKNYQCALCGLPPCKCSAVIYFSF